MSNYQGPGWSARLAAERINKRPAPTTIEGFMAEVRDFFLRAMRAEADRDAALRGATPTALSESERVLFTGGICGPHCDSRVLHAPGECGTCDEFPHLQYLREHVWRIAFTGRPREGYATCPAEAERGMASINSWHGNTPKVA